MNKQKQSATLARLEKQSEALEQARKSRLQRVDKNGTSKMLLPLLAAMVSISKPWLIFKKVNHV